MGACGGVRCSIPSENLVAVASLCHAFNCFRMSGDNAENDAATEDPTEIQIDSRDIPWARYAAWYVGVVVVSSTVVGIFVWAFSPLTGSGVLLTVLLAHGILLVVVLFYYIKQLVMRSLNNATVGN